MTPAPLRQPVPADIRETAYKIAYRWAMPDEEALTKATATIAAALMAERERAAGWHDQRARDTPDAFEMEFHQVSAAAIREGPGA